MREDVLAAAHAVTAQTVTLRAQSLALAESYRSALDANRHFAELYDFVPIPYLITSNVGVIQQINIAGMRLLGGRHEWIVGRPLIAHIVRDDMPAFLTALASSPKQGFHTVELHLLAGGGIRTVQLFTRVLASRGSKSSVHMAIVDMSEIRQLEQERRRIQEGERVARAANEAKDKFLAMLSHELRTPLTPVLAAADSLASHDVLPDALRAKVEIIRRNAKAEARLVDDLLDLARITGRDLQVSQKPTDAHSVIADVIDGWVLPRQGQGAEFDVRLEAADHWVNADPGRLAQVIRNVVTNAIKFTGPGSRIRIRSISGERLLSVIVSDNGVGMTPTQMERLFTPFVQDAARSPRRGLGLGLAISRAIVQAHDGTIGVWSEGPGRGTTVRVDLPTIPEPAAKTQAPPGRASESGRAARVLLVEDDHDSSEMLAMLLSSEGFQVETAFTLSDAKAKIDGCDAIVSDIALPDGSGLDLMRELHARSGVRGIALSGFGSSKDIEKSLQAGFDEHLTKPVDLDQLIAAVRRLVGARTG